MPRGVITLVFDDGYERVYRNVVPLLDRYSFRGVFAIPLEGDGLEKTEQRTVYPWQKWISIQEKGHEIASHSLTHSNLTKLSDTELEQELRDPAQRLNTSTLIYPGGAFDERVVVAARKYYSAGRTVLYGFEKLPPKDPMRLRSYNFSRNNFSVSKANMLALWAYLSGSWLIETYHMVDDHDEEMVHTVKTKDFKRHLEFVSRLPIQVKTISEVMNT